MSFFRIFVALLACLGLMACDAKLPAGLGGVRGDSQTAHDLYRRVRDLDASAYGELEERVVKQDQYAAFYLGLIQHSSSSPAIRMEAAQNYVRALPLDGARHNLALLLISGVRAAGTYAPAALLEAASKNGRVDSMLLLASILEQGRGELVPKNPALAKQWYQAAIDRDKSPYAELRLGAMMQAASSDSEAQKLLLSAAKYGFPEAQFRLSQFGKEPRVATQWKVVASLNDPATYADDARKALASVSPEEAALIEYNAEMWARAFRNAYFQKPNLMEPSQHP